MPQSIVGTGHRPQHLGGHSDQLDLRLYHLAHGWLAVQSDSLGEGVREVISGLALGWDTALALAALDLNIPLVAAIPCPDQPRFWKPQQIVTWKRIKDRASEVHIICPSYAADCMQARNKFMVDRADTILALWNGKQSSGTYNCLRYAQFQGKPVINLWPAFMEPQPCQ